MSRKKLVFLTNQEVEKGQPFLRKKKLCVTLQTKHKTNFVDIFVIFVFLVLSESRVGKRPIFRRSHLRAKVEFDHIFRVKYFLMGSFDVWGIVVRMRMGDDVKGVLYSLPDKGRPQFKKTFSFGHCPNPLTPPPLTPIRATRSFFFGRQNSRFESHLKKMWEGEGDILTT